MDNTINRIKRADSDRFNRSEAINRRLITDAERIDELETHLKLTYTTIAILISIMVTVGFGLK